MTAVAVGCSSASQDPPNDSDGTTLVRQTVFTAQCRCHGDFEPSGGLNLMSPALEWRLVGRPSSQCPNQTLVIPGDPEGSYLVRKVTDIAPACGTQMPLDAPPSEDRLQLVRAWVASLAPPSRFDGPAFDP